MVELLLMAALGFLGSFGHCLGMCGPLTVAFSLSKNHPNSAAAGWYSLRFHFLLNLGRIISYALVGSAIGGLGSVLIAGGQVAGAGSFFRQGMTIFTGCLLIWFGLVQLQPKFLPQIPLLHPLLKGSWHQQLSGAMVKLSFQQRWWTPASLGLVWGLIPCGFLYAAQIKAAQTGSWAMGGMTMLAFGLGTLPSMLVVGTSISRLSSDRRSQLFRLGGWLILIVGILTLLRTGGMPDYTGYAALICLLLALIARPLSRLWSQLLPYRRVIGVGAFVLVLAHTAWALEHSFNWNLQGILFLLPANQIGLWAGILAAGLVAPAAFTSYNRIQNYLGKYWRQIHLLSVPALLLSAIHIVVMKVQNFDFGHWTLENKMRSLILAILVLGTLLIRSRWIWSLFNLEQFYVEPFKR